MAITVFYTGILAEKAGKSEETFTKSGLKSSVLESVLEKHPEFRGLSFVVSHNGVITHGESRMADGDRLTLIPPSPGG